MSILKEDGEFILICDNCEESYEERFEQFDDAVFAKKTNGWKSKKDYKGWQDICPRCQEANFDR